MKSHINKKHLLNSKDAKSIHENLKKISTTWADLWRLVILTQVCASHLICIKYSDLSNEFITLSQHPNIKRTAEIDEILNRRRNDFPSDIWIFQSHSNRIKYSVKPVTLIAFNQALKKASSDVTQHSISSKHALHLK